MSQSSSAAVQPPAPPGPSGGPHISQHERDVSSKPYREVTVAAMILGVVVGVVLAASITYAGLLIGFVVPASTVAAILGWGLLRGVLRRGSIVENNINQTVASAINNASAGVIFTFPALFLMKNVTFNPWAIACAAVAGAFLGTLFIIPLRKQMIEFERLRFPSGTAVSEILRSPGAGTKKSIYLIGASLIALAFGLLSSFELRTNDAGQLVPLIPGKVDLGAGLAWVASKVTGSQLQWPAYMPNVWALSLLSVGAGFISGRPGLMVLAGGVLANWVIAPMVVGMGWIPVPPGTANENAYLAGAVFGQINRPLGIGLLVGGALAGIVVAAPMLKAALKSLSGGKAGSSDELPVTWLYGGIVASLVLLTGAAYLSDTSIGLGRALLTAGIGTVWIWLAGVIIAQCAGRTDWSPISGMALLAVTLVLVVSGGSIGLAVLIGAAVCVAIGQGSDMMQDLKTGHLVGSRPVRQQAMQMVVSWIGPIVAVLTVYLIWETQKFGPGTNIPAAQATTLQQMIAAIQGGAVPVDKYLAGGAVGLALTLAAGGGAGVLVGLSMYLPLFYVLPYGTGCLLAMAAEKTKGRKWTANVGFPVAAGLLVGDSLSGVVFALFKLGSNV
jgi:putative OPT family oligopeptide transporter